MAKVMERERLGIHEIEPAGALRQVAQGPESNGGPMTECRHGPG